MNWLFRLMDGIDQYVLEPVDSWLLARFQSLTEWVQSMTGHDCLTQRYWVLGVQTAICCCLATRLGIKHKYGQMSLEVLQAVVNVAVIIWMPLRDGDIRSRILRGLRSSYRLEYRFWRLQAVGFTVFLIVPNAKNALWLDTSWWCLLVAYYYTMSCDPKPPCQSKVMEALRKLAHVPVAQPARVET